jgi:hypothetical protein
MHSSHPNSITYVRPRTDADFEGLEHAIKVCHAKTGYPLEGVPDARAFICDDQGPLEEAWVAVNNGEIVGHIAINKPMSDCPCVMKWRELHPHDRTSIATVGRLFVNPGKAKGVLRELVKAVRTWAWERNVRLIMYVVIWSPARAMMANVLTARQNWTEYGRSIYHSPDGWSKDAVCYVAPDEWQTVMPVDEPFAVVEKKQYENILARLVVQRAAGLWTVWCGVQREW